MSVATPAAIVSNIEDMSHWLIALMNGGAYKGKQVLPAAVLGLAVSVIRRRFALLAGWFVWKNWDKFPDMKRAFEDADWRLAPICFSVKPFRAAA